MINDNWSDGVQTLNNTPIFHKFSYKFQPKQKNQLHTRLQHKTDCKFIGSDTWGAGSVVWPSTNPAGNFWTGLDAASTERGTPSSLNSLLPENLLGNELN